MILFDKTSNNLFEQPETPIIPEPSSVNKAILSICEIPFIGFSFSFLFEEIKVPKASGSKVFLI